MTMQLIQGEFSTNDTLALITQMVQVKIKYHESKISENTNEEDIKARETKIKRLQQELFNLRQLAQNGNKSFRLEGTMYID